MKQLACWSTLCSQHAICFLELRKEVLYLTFSSLGGNVDREFFSWSLDVKFLPVENMQSVLLFYTDREVVRGDPSILGYPNISGFTL